MRGYRVSQGTPPLALPAARARVACSSRVDSTVRAGEAAGAAAEVQGQGGGRRGRDGRHRGHPNKRRIIETSVITYPKTCGKQYYSAASDEASLPLAVPTSASTRFNLRRENRVAKHR